MPELANEIAKIGKSKLEITRSEIKEELFKDFAKKPKYPYMNHLKAYTLFESVDMYNGKQGNESEWKRPY